MELNINSTDDESDVSLVSENIRNTELENITEDNASNCDQSDQPRGDESLIEWIDRQLKEAEERKKSKDENNDEEIINAAGK